MGPKDSDWIDRPSRPLLLLKEAFKLKSHESLQLILMSRLMVRSFHISLAFAFTFMPVSDLSEEMF